MSESYSILNRLREESFWREFLEYKKSNENFTPYETRCLERFIDEGRFAPIGERIGSGEPFPLARLVELNKKHSSKKRKVFVFDRDSAMFLKGMAYLLHRYDGIFSDNLYSFRRNIGVKQAIKDLCRKTRGRALYSYKVDIHDYFNSVSTDGVLSQLKEVLKDDAPLFQVIEGILREPSVLWEGEEVGCRKGIMAGVPISGFLANLYLAEMDKWFSERGIIYARYSDDVIVFAEDSASISEYEGKIKDFLAEKELTVNQKKEFRTLPGEPWEFLGFRMDGDCVDLAEVSVSKMKDKMRRKARALVRWKKRKDASDERAIKAFIRHFNRKFYDNPKQHEVTWCRWYFPTVTTSQSLKKLDEYMVSRIRYIATGKYTKANYNLRYEEIKNMGYRSLVNAYYRYKKTNRL